MDKNNSPLKVALHAMEERSCKVMVMYLQGPCQGAAVVVDSNEAEVDIFDIDAINAMKLLNDHLAKKTQRPVIALSLHNGNLDGVLYVKKPVKTDNMLAVLSQAKALLSQKAVQVTSVSNIKSEENIAASKSEQPVLKKYVIDSDEQKKTAKHEAAMQLNEKGFGAFIGNVSGVDVNDPKQFPLATYNPKEYFQGYVEAAFKASHADGQAKQLNSGWSPLLIFPQNYEIWLDADDKQLRAFAGLTINNMAGAQISITTLNAETISLKRALEKFQSMDGFIWKLACWASKGRYPVSIDIERPVFLKNWPNFTRLLITPHAMRISALLIQQPRTLGDIAKVLNIKPQYVFVFISAAYALNLAGQAKREADILVQPPSEIKPSKNQGFLGRIMSKLRS